MDELKKQYSALTGKMKVMLDKVDEEERGLNKEEKVDYKKMETEANDLKDRIEAKEKKIEIDKLEKHLKEPAATSPAKIKPKDPIDEKRFKSLGDQLRAVMQASNPARIGTVDERLIMGKTEKRDAPSGLNEGVGDEGGFLLQTDFSTTLVKKAFEVGILASRVSTLPLGANSNGITINALDDNSRATGSRWGGIQSYWAHEAHTVTPKKPSFRQMELKLSKLMGLCYLTDEVMADTTALESIVTQGFTEEFAFMIDEAIWNGSGVGQPLGILNTPAYIEFTRGTTLTVKSTDIVGMWARFYAKSRQNAVWFINQDVEPQLYTMTVGSYTTAFMPPGGLSGQMYASLMGRPIIPIEHTSALGTTGDIVLADMSQYLMVDKNAIQTAVSLHVRFLYDEQVFRFTYRVDGQPIWNAPLTPFAGTTKSPFVGLSTV